MRFQNPAQQMSVQAGEGPLILPFSAIDASLLAQVGGKAANLGELTRGGFAVPTGFCITTAAYELVASQAGLDVMLDEKTESHADDAALAEAARSCLLGAAMPAGIAEAIARAYRFLGSGEPIPVAVRSSATAEDLPFASFAGQQDTYLNVVGIEALLEAVRNCWASLWTDRAVSYRASFGIDQRRVQLAVVVQRQIESEVAGVLFTANPLTGKRRQAVIDANPGLGEAVVSGATNPDHFVVNTASGEIVERRPGDKRIVIRGTGGGGTVRTESGDGSGEACLSDEQIRALAELGARVEAHYRAPQDTEWAIDASGQLWLLQARPITTLYPLPTNVPTTDDELRVYLSGSVIQGVYRPLTPMGMQTFRLISSAIATFALGRPPKNPLAGLTFVVDIGQRLFLDVTLVLRNALGREVVIRILQGMEAQSAVIFKQLVTDPRLSLSTTSKWPTLRKIFPIALRVKIPLLIVGALLRPEAARKKLVNLEAYLRQNSTLSAGASSTDLLDAFERHILFDIVRVIRAAFPPAL
ncbi:MAG TPA: PEP/pyruvate-binding domain-containing protein, partial [Ktedonobacteraceae bacterium]